MKRLSWMLVLAVIVSVLIGLPVTRAEGTVELSFMGWEASPLETESVLKGIELFESGNPDIKVSYNPINGEYAQKLLTMIAGDAAPDTFFMGTDQYRNFQLKGVLMDLTAYFDKEYVIDDFIPSSAEIMQIDGKIFGVSSCTVCPAIYYNADLFDAAGVAYPPKDPAKAWTWEEFVEAAKALTQYNEDGSINVFGVYGAENDYPRTGLYFAAGGKYLTDDLTAAAVDNDIFRDVMTRILELRTVHNVAAQAAVLENMGMSGAQMLQTGKVAMLMDGSWCMQELANMNFNVGVGCLPKMGDNEVATTIGQAHVHSAWVGTKHPDEAWRFLSFLSSEAYQTDLVKAGLWMPNRTSMYTPEGIAKWYDKAVYGEGYDQMAPFFQNAITVQTALNPVTKANDAILNELNLYFSSEGQDLELTVENITTNVNDALSR